MARRTKGKPVKSKGSAAKNAKKASKRNLSASAKRAKKPASTKLKGTTAKSRRLTTRTAKKKTKSTATREEPRKQGLGRRFLSSSGAASGRQTGDLEGLSRVQEADSESVDELVEEGNLFEAGAVAGVEEADNADEKEVHTHEVAEDDVPEEYLDKD